MSAHLKQHAINATADHAAGTNGTLLGTESNALAEKAFGTVATADLIVQRQSNGQVTVPATPILATDAGSKGYIDTKVAEGISWKEILLHANQLENGGTGGINQAILAAIATNLTVGDTVSITDGTTTETWTGVAGAPAAFQFTVGGSITTTTDNLVAAINADSTLWDAVKTTGLDTYFSSALDPSFVVYRATPTAANDRIYGTLATSQTRIQVVAFNGQSDYAETSGTQSDLPSADPAAKRFGFGRLQAALIVGESHRIADDNTAWTWDGDDAVWQQTALGSALTEGDGIDITANKVSAQTATATVAGQHGGLVRNRTSDGTGAAAADQGYLAVKTDNVYLNADASNQLAPKAGGPLARMKAPGSWSSTTGSDKDPTLAELNAALGTAAGDIGNWCFMVEGGPSTGSNSTFLAYKKANAGALADYHTVELS